MTSEPIVPGAHHPPHRRGTALIMALLILAGLMLLGLPFLFSQSSSLSGARSFQAQQAARIYAESARNLGAALAAYAVDNHWRQGGTQQYTALEQYLVTLPLTPPLLGATAPPVVPTNHVEIDATALGFNQPGSRVRVGIALEDESGKLDANALGPQGWGDLLKAVGIPDWDDEAVQIVWVPGSTGADTDQVGELADALAHRRLTKGRYLRLEQLLEADPQTYRGGGAGSSEYLKFRKPLTRAELELLRPYLSFHNLAPGRSGLIDLGTVTYFDTLAQYSSTSGATTTPSLRQWTDTKDTPLHDGTWVEAETSPLGVRETGYARPATTTAATGVDINYYPSRPQVGSALFISAPPPLNLHQLPQVLRDLPAYRGALTPTDADFPQLTATTPLVTWYGKQISPLPVAPNPTNLLPLSYLKPVYQPEAQTTPAYPRAVPKPLAAERQPLDIKSGGAVTVEHAATVVDPLGNPIAQESRRTVMQAVPQEGLLESRWDTQGRLQPLIDQRYGSRMVTWPMPTNRVTDVQVDDVDPAIGGTPLNETGVSFQTNPTLAATAAADKPTHVAVEWQANLGGGTATTKATVLNDGPNGLMPDDANFRHPTPDQNSATHEGLYPDGIRLGAGTEIAYTFTSDNKGPLTWRDNRQASLDSTMGHRSISVWVRPEIDWRDLNKVPTGVVTIMEARAVTPVPDTSGLANLTIALDATSDIAVDNALTNYFGVLYDRTQNMLVATYGTPGFAYAPLTAPATNISSSNSWVVPWNMADDNSATADTDERCLFTSAAPFKPLIAPRMLRSPCTGWSPVYLPNRIMTCYKLGNRLDSAGQPIPNYPEKGRWYHLQVTIGNGRPGGMGIIVDGIAGSDVGLLAAKDYYAQRAGERQKGPRPGDHLTIPSLVLTNALAALPRPMANPTTDLNVAQIEIQMPGFSPFTDDDYSPASPTLALDPLMTLPQRGSVLVGDEYIRYQGIQRISGTDLTMTAKYALMSCTRGDRQDSYTNRQTTPVTAATTAQDALVREPMTENHAAGSRVIADGCRLTPAGTNDLYSGGTTTVGQFVNGPTVDGVVITTIASPSDPAPIVIAATGTVFTLDPSGWDNAPQRGYCRITQSDGSKIYAYFTERVGRQLKLWPPAAQGATLGLGAEWMAKLPDGSNQPTPSDAILRGSATVLNNTAIRKATVTLVSMEVADNPGLLDGTGKNWQLPFGESDRGNDYHSHPQFQIMDPQTGRCEWIRYTDIIRHVDGEAYFIDRNGWNYVAGNPTGRSRAQERTPYRADIPFPDGSVVLPVQTGIHVVAKQRIEENSLHSSCKMLSPGDLITFVPRDYAHLAPIVAAVRYSSNDGYDGTLNADNDTVNGHFALTAPLALRDVDTNGDGVPDVIGHSSASWDIVMGTGLNTQLDLTPLNTAALQPSALPRLDAHQVGGPARLVFGAPDPQRFVGPGPAEVIMSIDAPAAIAPWSGDPNATFAGKVRRVIRDSTCVDRIKATDDLPLAVEFDQALFTDQQPMGLIEIGGEVFAWRRPNDADQVRIAAALDTLRVAFTNVPPLATTMPHPLPNPLPNPLPSQGDNNWSRFCVLVGRGLLNSTPREHLVDLSPDASQLSSQHTRAVNGGNLDHGPEAMRLPVGPVSSMLDPAAYMANDWYTVSVDGTNPSKSATFTAPAVLVCDPLDGSLAEIVQATNIDPLETVKLTNAAGVREDWTNANFGKWLTPEWLHGLYNTEIQTTWAVKPGGNGDVQPLLIGWWTRFPSALPSTPPASAANRNAQLRSRAFPWIGFCMRLARARFDDQQPFQISFDPSLATNQVLIETQPNLTLEVRAMAGTIDGNAAVTGALEDPARSGLGDWSIRTAHTPALPPPGGAPTWLPLSGLYTWNTDFSGQPNEIDGVEVRLSFRYTGTTSSRLDDIARAANRAPLIGGAILQGHAPITVLATEGAR